MRSKKYDMMTKKQKIKHRNKTIRDYINNRNWDKNPEFILYREVIKNLYERKKSLSRFKYVYDFQWEVESGKSNEGEGDLIFTDGNENYLIVECKTQKPKKTKEQVIKYIKKFNSEHEESKNILGLAVTEKGWDVYSEDKPFWEIDLKDEDIPYYEFYDDIEDSEEIKRRDKFLKIFRDLCYTPTNPISALEELEKDDKIEIIESPNSDDKTPPFTCHAKIQTNFKFLKKMIIEKHFDNLKKDEVKSMTAAKVCKHIYLPFTLENIKMTIDEWKKRI